MSNISRFTLRSHPDFFRKSRRISSPMGLFFVRATLSEDQAGSAVITPKKNFKRAVDRHAAKRKIRAVLQKHRQSQWQIVVVPSPSTLNMSFAELCGLASQVLTRL